MFLGFSSGLPLALSGGTLLVWMTEAKVNLGTIGLFALVGTPYTIKFLWAPLIDALDVPFLSHKLRPAPRLAHPVASLADRRDRVARACDPAVSPVIVAVGALMVATASATQDIVVDAFRVESLDESEQAAGMASYVAAYRIGMLASTAGALFLVSGFEGFFSLGRHAAWSAGYAVMAVLVLIGIATTLIATEPEKSARGRRRAWPRKYPGADRRSGGRRVLGVSVARLGAGRARLRHPLQVHRRARRRADRAVRDRSRLFAQRIRRHHQGRRPGGDADRRFRRRLRGARLVAAGEPVDRRRAAGGRHAGVLLGRPMSGSTRRG